VHRRLLRDHAEALVLDPDQAGDPPPGVGTATPTSSSTSIAWFSPRKTILE
jgi:hypothetical protein